MKIPSRQPAVYAAVILTGTLLALPMALPDLVDLSVNQTLGPSLLTKLTEFLAILPIAVFGGSAVETFAVPMAHGIVIAAISSVFLSARFGLLVGDWRRSRKDHARIREAPDTTVHERGLHL